MADDANLFFDNRFMERHAGSIIQDPAVAIVELVADARDAWATRVDVVWPESGGERFFEIEDNGEGMSEAQFRLRWRTLDYDRVRSQGRLSNPPPDLKGLQPLEPYGRNGKGRHVAFRFGEAYRGRVTIIPMTYATFVKRAEKRMLGLRDKLKDVPFLRTQCLDAEAFLTPRYPRQAVLFGDAAQTGR